MEKPLKMCPPISGLELVSSVRSLKYHSCKFRFTVQKQNNVVPTCFQTIVNLQE
jgi:hypothetical protein